MTFPFSDEFKFTHLESMREDDMTSSNYKDFEWRWHLNFFQLLFCKFLFFFTHGVPGLLSCQARKSGGTWPSKHTGILKVIWTLKLRGSFENYLQKKINLLGNFVKIIFLKFLFLPWKNAHHLYFIFLIILVYKKLFILNWFDFLFIVLVS